MFYQFLKVLVGYTLKIFFRKIYISGTENIHNDKAQLIASNHPNGFLEPLIMACFFPKDLHFLVRGDVFDNVFLKPILIATHQIPIFRFRDGFSKLRENSQTMDESTQVLLDKKNLLIFAEGSTQSIKKLRPLQKGLARIAFQTMEKKPDLDLEIISAGINFTDPSHFNKEVMLRLSPAIKVKPYFEIYQTDKTKGIDLLLADVYNTMKENIIHLENQDRLECFEKLVSIQRSKNFQDILPIMYTQTQQLDQEKALAEQVDRMSDVHLTSIQASLDATQKKFKTHGFSWKSLTKTPIDFVRMLVILIGFIPAIIGVAAHALPLLIGNQFIKAKVKQREFKASILMVSVLVLTLLQYIIFIAVLFVTEVSWIWLIIFIVTGLWSKYYYTLIKGTIFTGKSSFIAFRKEAQNILSTI